MRLRPDRKYQREEEAKVRAKQWEQLSPEQQLESLKARRGESKKQIARIHEKKEVKG